MIYVQTTAQDIEIGNPYTLVTKNGNLQARSIVQASGEPFWDKNQFSNHIWIKMSYGLAVALKDTSAYPQNMYITTDCPIHSISSADYENEQVLICGGESHEYDENNEEPDVHS